MEKLRLPHVAFCDIACRWLKGFVDKNGWLQCFFKKMVWFVMLLTCGFL